MRINPAVLATDPPAVVQITNWLRRYRGQGPPLIHMGQAIPDIAPPAACLQALAAELPKDWLHRYGPDQGIPELRQAIADDFYRRHQIALDPEREILVTGGANHAFVLALLATVAPGERVVLPAPCYFNHRMALQMLSVQAGEWPMSVESNRFRLDLDRLPELTAPPAAGVVCVNPNNPTGTVYTPAEMEELVRVCVERGLVLFYDEVYRQLNFEEAPTIHPFAIEGGRAQTIVMGSFSKIFGMTGWRVGYVLAPPAVIEQMLKVQDTTLICAPVAAQMLAAACLEQFPDHAAGYRALLRRRAEALRGVVEAIPGLRWRQPAGALFTLIGCDDRRPSTELAEALIAREGLAVVPGAAFGAAGEHQLRISFGFTEEPAIAEAGVRLKRFFSGGQNP